MYVQSAYVCGFCTDRIEELVKMAEVNLAKKQEYVFFKKKKGKQMGEKNSKQLEISDV